jgi:hypothetical protein
VTSLLDGVAVDGECRLREAIRAAVSDLAVNECPAGSGADEISLSSAGTYLFDLGQELVSAGELTIRGVGAPADVVVDLDRQSRFLHLQFGAVVRLERMTIVRGPALGSLPSIGGAIRGDAGASLTLRDAVVADSEAVFGGGIGGLSVELRMEGVELRGNRAVDLPGASTAQGGGLAVTNFGTGVHLEDVRIEGNRATAGAAGAVAQAGGASIFVSAAGPSRTVAILRRVVALDNESGGANPYAAGVVLSAGQAVDLRVEDGRFAGNRILGIPGSDSGAGLDVVVGGDGRLEMRRLDVAENEATGGAVQLLVRAEGAASVVLDGVVVRDSPLFGGIVSSQSTEPLIAGQLTIVDNAPPGLSARRLAAGEVRIENSLLWGNDGAGQPAVDLVTTGAVDADRTLNHNWIGDLGDPDPLFVDPAGGDYSLSELSGAVDAGDASFISVGPYDANHAPRVVGVELDLGALERGGLFADGFETSSASAWSDSIP